MTRQPKFCSAAAQPRRTKQCWRVGRDGSPICHLGRRHRVFGEFVTKFARSSVALIQNEVDARSESGDIFAAMAGVSDS